MGGAGAGRSGQGRPTSSSGPARSTRGSGALDAKHRVRPERRPGHSRQGPGTGQGDRGCRGIRPPRHRVHRAPSGQGGRPVRRTRRPQRAGLRRVVHQPRQPGRGAVASQGHSGPHRRPPADLVRPAVRALARRVLAPRRRLGVARIVAGPVPAAAMHPGRARRGQPRGRGPCVRSAADPPGHARCPSPFGTRRV